MAARQRVLIIGVGSIGERHVRCFLATGRANVSLCEVEPRRRDDVAGRHDVSAAYDSLDAALEAGPELVPDVAVVATPAPYHVPMATRLVEAGVHVLIEKPLGVFMDGVDTLRAAVASRGVVAAVAYVLRVHPALAAMRAAITRGEFGTPLQLVAAGGQHFPTYRPAYRETYYTDHATGGGAVQDALTHTINASEWLVGPVTSVVFDVGHMALEGVTVEDTVQGMARHGEVMASYAINQHQAPNEGRITVVCAGGTARFEQHRNRWRWMKTPGTDWNDEPVSGLERDTLFTTQANAFLDAVEGSAPPPCTLEDGIQTLRVNRAVLASAAARQWRRVE